jgi:hypothetical protein
MMRAPTFLSPSSLALWESDREAFYLKHLADERPPRVPQADYMSIGSAFDAYVKSALHDACFGKGTDPQFEFDAIFTEQVEEHNRDWALKAGEFAMLCYKDSGSYNELLKDLLDSEFDPQFEFKVEGEIKGVPLLGKPDCRYIHKGGAHVILDWKVNGFCSKYGASPYKGFAMIRDGWTAEEGKPSRGTRKPHKMYEPMTHHGVEIGSHFLEETCEDWADQLSIYGWMLGEKVGDENVIVCIDQLACKPKPDSFPWVRVANHRCRISEPWQQSLVQRLTKCWAAIKSRYIFDNIMSREDSDQRCEMLDMRASAHKNAEEGGIEAWVCEVARESVGFRKR